ncbi:MAG TPA: diaminopimelate epimerase, partial [Terriglobia bacterium]|nr:diaminopimelate epimerase [Terriglobia bacterium]
MKLQAVGNDFIVADAGKIAVKRPKTHSLARLARAICDRHTGVGADGFLLVLPPQNRENHAQVRFFNADGGEAEMSGNGIRCVGGFLAEKRRRAPALRIETLAGVKTLEKMSGEAERWIFRVAMGWPVLEPEKIPFTGPGASAPVLNYPLPTNQGKRRVTVTSMGNPHCSLFVSDFHRINWRAVGQEIETNSYFPNRTNVEFIKVISEREIEVRYWERGVGQT